MLSDKEYNQLFSADETANVKKPSSSPATQKKEVKPAQPKPTSITDKILDVGKGAVAGLFKEPENVVQSVHDVANAVDNKFLGDKYVDNDTDYDFVPDAIKPQTGAGKTAQSLTAFAAGWVGVGKFISKPLQGVKLAAKLTNAMPRTAKVLGYVAKNASVDFITGDSSDERLADVLVNNNIFRNGFTEYLASKDTDTAAEARFKNVLEGAALGTATDVVAKALKGVKNCIGASLKGSVEGALDARKAGAEVVENLSDNASAVVKGMKDKGTWAKTSDTLTSKAQFLTGVKDAVTDPDAYQKNLEQAVADEGQAMLKGFNAKNYAEPIKGLLETTNPAFEAIGVQNHMSMAEEGLKGFKRMRTITADMTRNNWNDVLTVSKKLDDKEAITTEAYYLNVCAKKHLDTACEQIVEGVEGGLDKLKDSVRGVVNVACDLKIRGMDSGQKSKLFDIVRTNFSQGKKVAGTVADQGAKDALQGVDVTELVNTVINDQSDEELVAMAKGLTTAMQNGGGDTATIIGIALGDKSKALRSLVKEANDGLLEGGIDKAMAYRYVAMLSSIKTHGRNIIGNTLKVPIMSFEETVKNAVLGAREGYEKGGLLGSFAGALHGAREGLYYSQGLYYALGPAWEQMNTALKYGQAFSRSSEYGNIGKQVMGDSTGLMAKIGSSKLNPMTWLAAEDEFFSSWAGTAKSYQMAMIDLKRSGALNGIKDASTRQEIITKWVDDYMHTNAWFKVTAKDGQSVKALAMNSAVNAANEATYQQKLTGVFQKIDKLANSNKFIKLILPFTKTPSNLLLDTMWVRNPVPATFNLIKAYRAKDWEKVAQEVSHLTSGIALWSTAGYLVHDGLITGKGPENKNQLARLKESGWQPSSIKMGDKYVSLQSFQPYGSILEFLATQHEAADRKGSGMFDADAIWSAMTTTVADQTFFKGLSDFMQSITTTRGQMGTQLALSFMPALLRDLGQFNDPVKRLTPDFYDKIYNKAIPFESMREQLLAPQVSWLEGIDKEFSQGGTWGAFFNPFNISEDKRSVVFSELSKAKDIGEPSNKIGSFELNNFEYSDYCRTIGTVKLQGKTLYETLSDIINSDEYQHDVIHSPDPSPYELEDNRNKILAKVVRQFRDAAKSKFLNDHRYLTETSAYADTNDKEQNTQQETNNQLDAIVDF